MPVKKERDIKDMDRVYDNPSAVCKLISSYILSKGDLKTNKVSNKFANIEILQANGLHYLAVTSGRFGSSDIAIRVKRFNSEVFVKDRYFSITMFFF